MDAVGIVCEYNPLHSGHKRQIDLLREMGHELIICAMSGNYTERGELAIADKYTRAESAIRCGADIVIELPFPYSTLSAEGFSRAGVHILAGVGCKHLSFGSECADTDSLLRASDAISSESFISDYSDAPKSLGSATAFFETLSKAMGKEAKLLSNDILAISYISAIKNGNYDMGIIPIKREGMAYNAEELEKDSYPSATALRKQLKSNDAGFSSLDLNYLPQNSLEALKKIRNPIFIENIEREVLAFFKLMTPKEITERAILRSGGGKAVADDGCGIVERLCASAKLSSTIEDFLQASYTAKYTYSRIKRVILFSLLGVSDIFYKELPQFTNLLGVSEAGRKHLSEIRKNSVFPIITKPADAPEGHLSDILQASDQLYCMAAGFEPDYFIKKHPFLLRKPANCKH